MWVSRTLVSLGLGSQQLDSSCQYPNFMRLSLSGSQIDIWTGVAVSGLIAEVSCGTFAMPQRRVQREFLAVMDRTRGRTPGSPLQIY